ncbi:MAG: DUF6157 family protein [Actinomycetota bacterium]|nr:DUF6157 family protein [Actinomycetota bacterium]
MADLNYYDTLIAVADDCPVDRSVVPTPRGGKPTVATLQYEMLAGNPHVLTQEDVLFESWLARQDLDHDRADRRRLREEFFSKPQACMRSSPLPKQYGWGLLFDGEGRVALLPMESPEYQRLVAATDTGVKVLKAMRSKRA